MVEPTTTKSLTNIATTEAFLAANGITFKVRYQA